MPVLMCGFNGFQQINGTLPENKCNNSVIVIPSAIKSNFFTHDNEQHISDNPVSHKFRTRYVKSIAISWSSMYILYDDGCVSVQGGTKKSAESAEIIRDVKHLCCGW